MKIREEVFAAIKLRAETVKTIEAIEKRLIVIGSIGPKTQIEAIEKDGSSSALADYRDRLLASIGIDTHA